MPVKDAQCGISDAQIAVNIKRAGRHLQENLVAEHKALSKYNKNARALFFDTAEIPYHVKLCED